MSITQFNTTWSSRVFSNYRDIPGVWRQAATDLSSEFSNSNKYNLVNLDGSSISVVDYVADTDVQGNPDVATDESQTLELNQSKSIRIYLDDIHSAITSFDAMNVFAQRAAEKMSATIDAHLKAQILADVATAQKVSSGTLFPDDLSTLTTAQIASITEKIFDLSLIADTNFWPAQRTLIIGAHLKYVIQKYLANKGVQASDSVQGAGLSAISNLLGFNVAVDAGGIELPDTANDVIAVAVNPQSLFFAQKIASVEVIRPEKRYGDLVKMLSLYGSQKAFGSSDKNTIIYQASS